MTKLNKKNILVTIYPAFNAFRYSYHIHGLRMIFQDKKIEFSSKEFPPFKSHSLAFIHHAESDVKVYISAGDGPGLDKAALEWCDVYAKRTLLKEQIPKEFTNKIIPMGPHFGIRTWGIVSSFLYALKNYLLLDQHELSLRDHFWYYFKQYYFRRPEKDYIPQAPKQNYIFYASTLYPTHPGYNQYRALFIEACSNLGGISFEGGLIRKDNFRIPEYERYTINKYYPIASWIQKQKDSMLGFWAPGDQGAMTLKLGEFLSLGKAIIAVPIRQEQLPSPILHGEHVHFVDGSLEEMKAAVHLLTTDHEYRQKLERNARIYYEQWVSPTQAIKRFISEGSERAGIQLKVHPLEITNNFT